MNKDDAFFSELQVNDRIKVTVNFFGQEIPFEGTCTGISEDKLSILTNAKPEPVELPLSSIIEGTITIKNQINIKKTEGDNTYENIEIKHPEVVYGYYIVDLNNEIQSDNIKNNTYEFDKFDLPTSILLSIRDFTRNGIINDLYNKNAFDLSSLKTFTEFCRNNNNKDEDLDELYQEYSDSFDIYINKNKAHGKVYHYLKKYLPNLIFLDSFIYFLPQFSEEEQSYFKKEQLNAIVILFKIIYYYAFFYKISDPNKKQHMLIYINFLFKYQLTLKHLLKSNIFELIKNDLNIAHVDLFIKFITLLIPMAKMRFFYKNKNEYSNFSLINNWYKDQVISYNLFNLKHETNFNKPALIPLISINNSLLQSTKHTLIHLLYSIYTNEGKLLYIKVSNDELRNNLSNYIRTKHNIDNDLDLSIKTIFNKFTNVVDLFFSRIIKICKYFVSITFFNEHDKDLYNTINTNTNSVIQLLEHEANQYITITAKFNNRLRLFFKRIAAISSAVNKVNFSSAEDQLLLSYQNCLELIKESNEEVFSDSIFFYLDLINVMTHSEKVASNFYSKFITVINISIIKDAISFNTEINRIFIPIKISSSKNGQTSVIIKICAQSSLDNKSNEDIKSNIKLLPDNHLFYLVEMSFTDFNSVLNGFEINITLQYKFKTSWDFDKCEPTWETREITETFFIHEELKQLTEFHEIRNLFRDYSSGSVIKDDRMFFGREQDIRHVIENIRDESGRIVTNRCVCIYGQTRTGKSSLLYHIKKGLRSSHSNIVADIGDIGSAGASEAGIKYRILSCLLEEIELEHEDICNLLTNSGISMTADPERNKNDESYFTEQIGKIRSILKRKAKDTQIIILIDEFTYVYDWIKEKKLSENFMKFWKAFITNYDICAIIVGQDHMMKFINDQRFTNAFGAIRTWEVNYLKEPDACKLVTMPVSDSPDYAGQNGCTILPEAVNLLVEITRGSAYLLMNICADFIDYLNERHALTATRGHAEDFLRRHISSFEERWFEPLFNDKSELDSDASISANKGLLKKLSLSYSENSGVLPDELSLSEEEKERLHSLEARRVVEMKDGRWRITVRLYAEWLRNKFGSR
ncbi:ATP-binding protein [Succinimonas sp.]|uniref:ATP-binding protein n=1 Tax=Succinimonas sp. TaxID=1936151 RepID=UPI00386F6376